MWKHYHMFGDEIVITGFVLRAQNSQSQKFKGAVTGKDGGRMKRRKNGDVKTLPEISRVEIEEVG